MSAKKYSATVSHNLDGYQEYDKETFLLEEPFLNKSIKTAIKNNKQICEGDWLFGHEHVYIVIKVCHFTNFTLYYVEQDGERERFVDN